MTPAAGSARVAATTAGMSAATGMSTATTMPSTTAAMASATAAFGCVGRGRQRGGKNKDDNPELESRHDIPRSLWTYEPEFDAF